MATIERAIEIAAKVHTGKTDKGGDPYILHPIRVMMRMTSEADRITAVLHDTVEDSREYPPEERWTIDRLRKEGFSEKVLAALDGVTNREGENYEEFVERAAKNLISRQVKIADLEDNMNILRLGEIRPKDITRLKKYHRSWKRLALGSK